MDSIGNCNNSVARDLVKNINFYMTKENQPDFVEVSCTQQRNGYDCGPFVGLFAKQVILRASEGKPFNPCFVDKALIPQVCEIIKDKVAIKIMEHLTKEEGIKKMQEEEGNTNHVMEYAERLRKMIKEKTLTREGRWKDRNETNMKKDANKTKDVELHVEGEVVVENSKKNGEDRNEVSDGSNKIISVTKSLRRTCW